MTQDQWRELRESFARAENLPPVELEQVIAQLRESDALVAGELQKLLAAKDPAETFLQSPALPPTILERALSHAQTAERLPESDPGDVIEGRYRIAGFLGEGGFGRVYSALDQRLDNRKVVVKILKLPPGEALEKRFQQEVRALSRLDHPGIVAVTDNGRLPAGSAFLVMQYVEGRSLRDLLAEGAVPADRCIRLLKDMAGALAAAHGAGVLHRDLKPGNVIVCHPGTPQERAVLIDFGIARMVTADSAPETTMVAGSPQYMAPEQLLGRATPASDVYSLASVAFEMLVGRPRLDYLEDGPSSRPIKQALNSVRPAMPPAAAKAILGALAIDPAKRIGSAAAFAEALEKRAPERSFATMLWLVAALLCAIGVAVYVAGRPAKPPKDPAPAAPVKQLRVALKRRPRDGEPSPRPLDTQDPLRKGDGVEIDFLDAAPARIYAFDETWMQGHASSQLTLLFPGAADGGAIRRIPANPGVWLEFDGTASRESIWLVAAGNGIAQLEATRRFSLPPSFGALPDNVKREVATWLAVHSIPIPDLRQDRDAFLLPLANDPAVSRISLPVSRQ